MILKQIITISLDLDKNNYFQNVFFSNLTIYDKGSAFITNPKNFSVWVRLMVEILKNYDGI